MVLPSMSDRNVHMLTEICSKNEKQVPLQVGKTMFLKAKHKTFNMLRMTCSSKVRTVGALTVHLTWASHRYASDALPSNGPVYGNTWDEVGTCSHLGFSQVRQKTY